MSSGNGGPRGGASSPAARRSRAVRWAVGVGVALVAAIGLVLIFLLAQATNNRALYEQNYARLFGLNVVVAALLVLVIGWVAFRLLRRLQQGQVRQPVAHQAGGHLRARWRRTGRVHTKIL